MDRCLRTRLLNFSESTDGQSFQGRSRPSLAGRGGVLEEDRRAVEAETPTMLGETKCCQSHVKCEKRDTFHLLISHLATAVSAEEKKRCATLSHHGSIRQFGLCSWLLLPWHHCSVSSPNLRGFFAPLTLSSLVKASALISSI